MILYNRSMIAAIQSVAQNWTACEAAVLPQCVTASSPRYSPARGLNFAQRYCHPPTSANLNFTTFLPWDNCSQPLLPPLLKLWTSKV